MAYVLKNRTREFTLTAGTGALTLSGTMLRFRTFAAAGLAFGATFPYAIEVPSGAWETGIGTYLADGTVGRAFDDSSTGALLNLSGEAGTTVGLITTAAAVSRVAVNRGVVALAPGAVVATDASLGNVFTLVLGGNATLATPTNLAAGASYAWLLTQDATGGRTLAFGAAFKWAGGTAGVLSTAAGAVDLVSAVSDGAILLAVLTKGFA